MQQITVIIDLHPVSGTSCYFGTSITRHVIRQISWVVGKYIKIPYSILMDETVVVSQPSTGRCRKVTMTRTPTTEHWTG